MWAHWRLAGKRRLMVFGGIASFTAFYTLLVFMSNVTVLRKLPEVPPKKDVPQDKSEYTLPSLERMISSVRDLDLQHVLSIYRSQHEEIPADTVPSRIIIASTWRSGSTLLGEILSAYPGVFYHYEPFMPYGLQQLRPGPMQEEVYQLLFDLLHCDYNKLNEYLKFAYGAHDLFARNTRLWTMCSSMPRSKCFVPEILGRICTLFPIHVMKIVRARLALLEKLLEDSRVYLIWLVRDPRATISSRTNSVSWCTSKHCQDPGYLCSDLLDDYYTFIKLKRDYANQVKLIRYEDLARDPYGKSKNILEFVGLKIHPRVTRYLNDHLHSDEEAPWSTRHEPQKRMTRWMKLTPWETVVRTQYQCRTIMNFLGYRIFTSQEEMKSANAIKMINLPN